MTRKVDMFRRLVTRVARIYTRRWAQAGSGIRNRRYATYDLYLQHQASKLASKPERAQHYDNELEEQLRIRLEDLELEGARVLCLGARLGGEVRALRSLGAFAWGIDLNPGGQNAYVAFGDFHRLEIPDGACDLVFSNSLDHALDLEAVLRESKRVLRQGGLLVLELMDFEIEPPAHWESTYWESTSDVIDLAENAGFTVYSQNSIESPWAGEHVRLVASGEIETRTEGQL